MSNRVRNGAGLNHLYRYCIGHPVRVITLGVLFCAVVSPGVMRLRLRTDGHALVPHDAPEIEHDREIRREFGIDDPIVVVIQSDDPEGIFNAHTLQVVDEFTTAFMALDGVRADNVFSLATEYGDRVFPGTLRFRRLLEPVPTTREEIDLVRSDVRSIRLYSGTMVSFDERAAAIMVGASADQDRIELYRQIWDVIESRGEIPERVSVIGAPVAEAMLGTHILEDLGVPNVLLGRHASSNDNASPDGTRGSVYEARLWIARTIGLVPMALMLMAMVFAVWFRSWVAVVLPLVEAGACLVVVFAIMGWLGVPIYLTIAVMPIILTAAGVTDEIHLFSRYRDRLRESPTEDFRDVLLATMKEKGIPIVMTSVTTAIGFLAFAFSPIAPVQAFGVFTALGIVFCMAWSLTVIPAWLSLVDPKHIVSRDGSTASATPRSKAWFGSLGLLVLRCRGLVLIGAAAVVGLAPFGIRRMVVQDSWIDGFAPESAFRRATESFDEQFMGAHTLLVCVDTGRQRIAGEITGGDMDLLWAKLPTTGVKSPDDLIGWRLQFRRLDAPPPASEDERRRQVILDTWSTWVTQAKIEDGRLWVQGVLNQGVAKIGLRLSDTDRVGYQLTPARLMQPETVRLIGELESFIKTQTKEAVGGVVGTADYVKTVNFLRRGRKEAERRVPDTPDQIEWIWREYGRIRGEPRVRQLVDADFARSVVTVLMKNANFVGTARLMQNIRGFEAERLAPHGITLSFAGDVAVSQTLIGAIVGTQVVSVVAATLGDLAVTTILGRSLLFGILCVVPSSLAVLMNFAVMGLLGMPLGVATSMFSSMTLGIGVDYAIHFLQSHRHVRAENASRRDALVKSMTLTGPAILGNTLAVTLGFGVLMLSQVPANARLGGLLVLSLLNCFAATMLVLPAVLGGREVARKEP